MGGPIGTKSKFPPLSIPITGNPAKRVVLATGSIYLVADLVGEAAGRRASAL